MKYLKTPIRVELMDGGPTLVRDAADFNIAFMRTGQKEAAQVKGACEEAAHAINQHDELVETLWDIDAMVDNAKDAEQLLKDLRDYMINVRVLLSQVEEG